MSERSIKRANERRLAKERRRESVMRRRAGWAVGAAAGATVFLAPVAHADTLVVQTTGDGETAECTATDTEGTQECQTLRDAVNEANSNGEDDSITFASGVTGVIKLVQGQLSVISGYDTTIAGPGADVLAISGENASRIFDASYADLRIQGLTLSGGDGSTGGENDAIANGGAIRNRNGDLEIVDSVLSGNRAGTDASSRDGGAVYVDDYGSLALERVTVKGNRAEDGGGILGAFDSRITIRDSEISGNTADENGGGVLGRGRLTVDDTDVTGNTAADSGGGIFQKYGFEITDSTISGNTADEGGGLTSKYVPYRGRGDQEHSIVRTTISGNTGRDEAGGISIPTTGNLNETVIRESTISGNKTTGAGGGILFGYIAGDFQMVQSTVSGNTANEGGGLAFGRQPDPPREVNDRGRGYGGGTGVTGAFDIDNSTIARNTAAARGGGIYLGSYSEDNGRPARGDEPPVYASPTVPLTSTIVGDNVPQDVDRADRSTSGGLDVEFSLVEAAGDAPMFQDSDAVNVFGKDPQLGELQNNGGTTLTHVPARTSPAIDQGDAEPRLPLDQRLAKRTVDHTAAGNAPGGDGTDIGSTESATGPDAPATGQQQTTPPATPGPAPLVFRRVRPAGMTVNLSPKTDLEAPFRFRVSGKVIPPLPFTDAQACATVGLVNVQVKAGRKTISSRRVVVRPDCTYRVNVAFKGTSRFGKSRRLKFTARFLGNAVLEPIFPKSVFGRVREADGGSSSARR